MNIDQLRIFLEVCRLESFSAVARRRNVNPSSISRAVAALEARMGTRLLQRTTRRMRLTDSGRRLAQRAENLIQDLDMLADQIAQEQVVPSGRLTVSASVAFGERFLIPCLAGFSDRHPNVALDVRLSDRNVDLVEEGIDLAVRLGPTVAEGLVATRLFRTRYHVYCTPEWRNDHAAVDHPRDLESVSCPQLTIAAHSNGWRFRDDAGNEWTVRPGDGATTDSPLGLRSMVVAGLGPALLADWFVAEDVAAGRLVALLPDYLGTATTFDTGAWLVYPDREYLPARVRACIDYLKAEVAERPPGRLYGLRNA